MKNYISWAATIGSTYLHLIIMPSFFAIKDDEVWATLAEPEVSLDEFDPAYDVPMAANEEAQIATPDSDDDLISGYSKEAFVVGGAASKADNSVLEPEKSSKRSKRSNKGTFVVDSEPERTND